MLRTNLRSFSRYRQYCKINPMICIRNRILSLYAMKSDRCNEEQDSLHSGWKCSLGIRKWNKLSSSGIQCLLRENDEGLDFRCTAWTLRIGRCFLMVSGVVSANVPRQIPRMQGRIKATMYIVMLIEHFLPYSEQNFSNHSIFLQDNTPNHIAGKVKRFLEEH